MALRKELIFYFIHSRVFCLMVGMSSENFSAWRLNLVLGWSSITFHLDGGFDSNLILAVSDLFQLDGGLICIVGDISVLTAGGFLWVVDGFFLARRDDDHSIRRQLLSAQWRLNFVCRRFYLDFMANFIGLIAVWFALSASIFGSTALDFFRLVGERVKRIFGKSGILIHSRISNTSVLIV